MSYILVWNYWILSSVLAIRQRQSQDTTVWNSMRKITQNFCLRRNNQRMSHMLKCLLTDEIEKWLTICNTCLQLLLNCMPQPLHKKDTCFWVRWIWLHQIGVYLPSIAFVLLPTCWRFKRYIICLIWLSCCNLMFKIKPWCCFREFAITVKKIHIIHYCNCHVVF